jgi:ssDNA-binding Zn-finger/Zn-ribbon topoisomerase 1
MADSYEQKAQCPYCDSLFELRREVREWDAVKCPECRTSLQVIRVCPPVVDYAFEGEYDWEDD